MMNTRPDESVQYEDCVLDGHEARGERAPRVGISSTVFGVRAVESGVQKRWHKK